MQLTVRPIYLRRTRVTTENLIDAEMDAYYDGGYIDHAIAQERLREFADAVIAAERERIAQEWDGCITDAVAHGNVDVGASIRQGRLVDA